MADTTRSLTEGPVWRALASVSAPMSLGILAVLSVGLVDAYFLGRLGADPLAAVGYIYPVTTAVTSLSIGLSAGANAAVSQAIGREDGAAAEHRLALHAIGLGLALSLAVAALFWLVHRPLFRALGADEAVMVEIGRFIPWWVVSFPFLVVMMLVNAVFRAHGAGGTSATIMVLAALVNVALTPAFIQGWGPLPAMGTGGAAFATMLSRAALALAALAYAWHRGLIRLDCRPLAKIPLSLRQITAVGAPAALSNAINPAGMAAVTAAVATLGTAAVGGFGAATRIQSLALVPLLALSSGIGPVVGQNWGADRQDRAARALHWAVGLCLAYGLIVGGVLFAFAGPLARAIAGGPDPAGFAADYLRVVGWSLWGYGVVVVVNAAVNARSRALWSMGLSLSRIFALYLPLAWAGVMLFGFPGILGAAVAANVLAALGGIWVARRCGLWRLVPGRAPAAEGEAA